MFTQVCCLNCGEEVYLLLGKCSNCGSELRPDLPFFFLLQTTVMQTGMGLAGFDPKSALLHDLAKQDPCSFEDIFFKDRFLPVGTGLLPEPDGGIKKYSFEEGSRFPLVVPSISEALDAYLPKRICETCGEEITTVFCNKCLKKEIELKQNPDWED